MIFINPITCPHCLREMRAKEELDGKTIKCPACQKPFVVHFHYPDEQPVRRLPAVSPMVVLLTLCRWIDLVTDIRFKRYLTPWIVRIWWVLVLFICVAGFFFNSLSSLIASAIMPENPRMAQFEERRPQKVDAQKPSRVEKAINDMAWWLIRTFFQLVSLLLLLTFFRVLAELTIVLFNISNDMKKLKRT